MPVRRFKPTSPGRRHMSVSDFAEVTKSKPEKGLTEKLTKKGGRNNTGRITTRHQGGGHKRRYRLIDFKRTKDGVPAKVHSIEYDPNRSARIALLHYAELRPGQGGKMVRSAGGSAQLVAKEAGMALLRLPSGEMRRVQAVCRATVGQLGNETHQNESGGKAGRSRWKGKRPTVRGTVMNPVDHPHGGGEGKSKGGRPPVPPWGGPAG